MSHRGRQSRVVRPFLPGLFGAGLALVACTVGPDYVPPETEVPDAWQRELSKDLEAGEANLETWWETLGDPVLTELIERAGRGSLDLRIAAERVLHARALLGVSRSEFFPTVDGTVNYESFRISEEELFGSFGGGAIDSESYSIGTGGSWEIDLFGRVRRSVESAVASLQATVEDYRDVVVLLYAEVALTYIDVRTYQARILIAKDNAEAQRKTADTVKVRRDTGLGTDLDVHLTEIDVATTESTIPALENALARAIHRLGVLVGEHPGALRELLEQGPASLDRDDSEDSPPFESLIPEPPQRLIVGIPADVLRQRPDIRRAERELAAQTAKIGVATAELYPRLTLSGDVGLAALDFGSLFNGSAFRYGFSPSLRWNLFDGGRIRSNIAAQNATTWATYTAYEKTVLLSLEEVENALGGYLFERQRMAELGRARASAERAYELSTALIAAGLENILYQLDAQRSLLRTQNEFATSKGAMIREVVLLYKALGGGWKAIDGTEGAGDEDETAGEDEDEPEADGGAS